MKKKNNGFTLIELMVSVGLMVLLLGIVFNIFTSTSEVVTRTEATMEMFQNARVIFDIMSQDFTNAREITVFDNMTTLSDSKDILTLITTTSWIKTENNTQTQTIGSAEVTYSLKMTREFESKKLYYLQRKIKDVDEENAPNVIGEYLVAPDATDNNRNIPFYIEAFIYKSSNDSSNDSSEWENKKEPEKENGKYKIPPAVRVTMTLADEFLRNRQTFSRVFWIPQGK